MGEFAVVFLGLQMKSWKIKGRGGNFSLTEKKIWMRYFELELGGVSM